MPQLPDWSPDDIDPSVPSAARMYDYVLGGFANFESDRRLADWLAETLPEVTRGARANRAFLRRAVRFLMARDVAQFLDLGSGIPTAGNVHEIVHAVNPAARVCYVDIDPVAVTISRKMLADNPCATAFRGDVVNVDAVLD